MHRNTQNPSLQHSWTNQVSKCLIFKPCKQFLLVLEKVFCQLALVSKSSHYISNGEKNPLSPVLLTLQKELTLSMCYLLFEICCAFGKANILISATSFTVKSDNQRRKTREAKVYSLFSKNKIKIIISLIKLFLIRHRKTLVNMFLFFLILSFLLFWYWYVDQTGKKKKKKVPLFENILMLIKSIILMLS